MAGIPKVCDVVHYVSHGTPVREDGTQAFPSTCRAAIVTEVNPEEPLRVGLCVINPTGLFWHPLAEGGCHQAEHQHHGGTWHWPHP